MKKIIIVFAILFAIIFATAANADYTINLSGVGDPPTPAGVDTEIQFNDGGVLGASSDFIFDSATKTISLATDGLLKIGDQTIKKDSVDGGLEFGSRIHIESDGGIAGSACFHTGTNPAANPTGYRLWSNGSGVLNLLLPNATPTTHVNHRIVLEDENEITELKEIQVNQTTTPGVTTDKIYNVGGTLFWDGTDLTSAGTTIEFTSTFDNTLITLFSGSTVLIYNNSNPSQGETSIVGGTVTKIGKLLAYQFHVVFDEDSEFILEMDASLIPGEIVSASVVGDDGSLAALGFRSPAGNYLRFNRDDTIDSDLDAHLIVWVDGGTETAVIPVGTFTGTAGSIPFSNGTSIVEDNANLFWENTNKRLGIGVTDPDTKLEVLAAGNQLKLSFDGVDNTTFGVDTSGDLTITPSGNKVEVAGDIETTGSFNTATGASINEFSIDGTLVGDSDIAVPTEKAVKTYVDSENKAIAARYNRSSNQSIPSGVYETIDYNVVKFDTDSAVTTGANWKFEPPKDGKYNICATALTASVAWTAGQMIQIGASVNSDTNMRFGRVSVQANFTGEIMLGGCILLDLTTTDDVAIEIYHNRGVNTTISNTYFQNVSIHYVGE